MEIKPVTSGSDDALAQRLKRRRKIRLFRGVNSTSAMLLSLVLVLMLNYLSSRHYVRFDLSYKRESALSGKTRQLLTSLDSTVRMTALIQPDHEIFHLVHDDLIQLLARYEYAAGGRLTIDRIDPDRQPGRAAEIMSRYDLDEPNVILIEQGEHIEIVDAIELADIDYGPVMQGGLARMKSFKGEQVLSSALFRLIERKPARVYFLQGQGERDFDEHDPYTGLSRIGNRIRREYIELIPLRWSDQLSIPDDASALILAAPTREFTPESVERLRAYFHDSGRILLLMNAETDAGLDALLDDWGIRSVDSMVVDPARTLSGYEVLIDAYESHPVTERMNGLSSVLYWPRAVPLAGPGSAAGKAEVSVLAYSSGKSWAELDLQQRPPVFNPESDIRGPVPVAVAVTADRDKSGTIGIEPGRAVIIGDAEFISNTGLTGANADLLLNALNWMLERLTLLDIAPRDTTGNDLLIEARRLRHLFWIIVVAIPLTVAATGIIVWRKRSI